jgi:hypothetical protein
MDHHEIWLIENYEFECRKRIEDQGEKQPSLPKRSNNDGEGSGSQRRVDFSLISVCCLSAVELDAIVLDSGATRHMSGERSFFTELSGISPGSWPINCIGGKLPHAVGMGTIKLTTSVNGANVNGELKNALYVPGLGVTLISIAYLSISGYAVFFSGLNAIVEGDNTIIMTAL